MKKLIIIASLLLASQSFAGQIECHAERLGKVFKLSKTEIAMADLEGRSIASIGARTRMRGQSIEKMINFNNKMITIHVDNKESFSPLNDYVALKNSLGHQITYPIECYKK
jgi:hypothetical protein